MNGSITLKYDEEGIRRIVEAGNNFRNLVGFAIKDKAKELCPVKTGNLRDSINVTIDTDGLTINADADYSIFVELGTRHMAAQPFMIPAIYDAKRQFAGYGQRNKD